MRNIIVTIAFAVGALTSAPTHAAGLLQDLFERFERPAPVVYRYAPPEQHMRFIPDEGFRVSGHAHRAAGTAAEGHHSFTARKIARQSAPVRHVVAARKTTASAGQTVAKPCCKNPEASAPSIDDDKTLRVGDAYMTPLGLRIYDGRRPQSESPAFVDYRKAGIGADLKARLEAVDRQGDGNSPAATAPDRLAVVSYVTAATSTDRTSIDATGRKIRVVGP